MTPMRMARAAAVLLAGAAAFLILPAVPSGSGAPGHATAFAGPPEGRGHGNGHGPPAHAGGGPPPWAPAHGYRAKHGDGHRDRYVAIDGRTIDRTFGILDGACNRELIGQVLGGAAGAAAGSQIGSGSGQTAAIIGGTILGVLIGGDIGRTMDDADQRCVGQTLEHAPDGRTVRWRDPNREARYRVTPTETYRTAADRYCREYTSTAVIGGQERTTYGTACRQPDGSWELQG